MPKPGRFVQLVVRVCVSMNRDRGCHLASPGSSGGPALRNLLRNFFGLKFKTEEQQMLLQYIFDSQVSKWGGGGGW